MKKKRRITIVDTICDHCKTSLLLRSHIGIIVNRGTKQERKYDFCDNKCYRAYAKVKKL